VEWIAGKVECRDKEMAYLEEERPKPNEPKISWALKNSTRFGNNNAYVAGSLALLGCTWINSREGYECTYAIVVAGETRDSKGDPIKACSAQRLVIKEQNNTGNQTMWITYDPRIWEHGQGHGITKDIFGIIMMITIHSITKSLPM